VVSKDQAGFELTAGIDSFFLASRGGFSAPFFAAIFGPWGFEAALYLTSSFVILCQDAAVFMSLVTSIVSDMARE
jgi:hypothetical protein